MLPAAPKNSVRAPAFESGRALSYQSFVPRSLSTFFVTLILAHIAQCRTACRSMSVSQRRPPVRYCHRSLKVVLTRKALTRRLCCPRVGCDVGFGDVALAVLTAGSGAGAGERRRCRL